MSEADELVTAWRTAARDERVAAALEGVYAETAAAISRRNPACWASGRCCNFAKSGHLLYVTGLEAAYAVDRLPETLLECDIEAAEARGDCPFLDGHLCGIHAIKPLACRTYFCDRSATAWHRELSEAMHGRIREIHARLGVPYRYQEWRSLLRMFASR